MARYNLVSKEEAKRIRQLSDSIGELRFRTLITGEGKRVLRPGRLENLKAGRGKLSETEREAFQSVSSNVGTIKALGNRGQKKGLQTFKTNRAIRTWVLHGKDKSTNYRKQLPRDPNQLRAIKALRLLGVDDLEGQFYVNQTGS